MPRLRRQDEDRARDERWSRVPIAGPRPGSPATAAQGGWRSIAVSIARASTASATNLFACHSRRRPESSGWGEWHARPLGEAAATLDPAAAGVVPGGGRGSMRPWAGGRDAGGHGSVEQRSNGAFSLARSAGRLDEHGAVAIRRRGSIARWRHGRAAQPPRWRCGPQAPGARGARAAGGGRGARCRRAAAQPHPEPCRTAPSCQLLARPSRRCRPGRGPWARPRGAPGRPARLPCAANVGGLPNGRPWKASWAGRAAPKLR
jgi:hypothetical protein